ncbi:hypothetical protein BDV30DRAFT_1418 [Aspergillus minisclerotigenes]|uniref:Uncharacterized protein n=1 Tax=Aspergillus minisclerotigenes TaxID=656917 RepID=A0A5N6JNE9_9EURO|nr:hypothetical protein BDV30DRAFT_1418 [Aspergillus minisclerotigenes]
MMLFLGLQVTFPAALMSWYLSDTLNKTDELHNKSTKTEALKGRILNKLNIKVSRLQFISISRRSWTSGSRFV